MFLQLWEISSGELLLSVLFDVSIMSVTLDPCEYFIFCGGSDGSIFQVSLCSTVSWAPSCSCFTLVCGYSTCVHLCNCTTLIETVNITHEI